MSLVAALATGVGASAADDEFAGTAIVFVRGSALIKSDGKGRGETEIATLADKAQVRALRTDAVGKILLADIGGTWSWMPLDGSTKALTQLPCEAGPAQLSEDGRYVFCRKGTGSLVVNLVTGKLTSLPVPTVGARLLGSPGVGGNTRPLVWADKGAIWSAIAPKLDKPRKVVPEAPLRNLMVAPDGTHAIGTYQGDVYESPRGAKKPAEVLMTFALDGQGARRKAIQNGVPVDWSFDSKWVLVQDGASACIMLVAGGQYKCWRGFTAVSISPDGRYALVLGNRSSDSDKKADKKADKKSKKKSDKKKKDTDQDAIGEAAEGDTGDEPVPTDDVAVPPPSGPRSLYRAQLEGAYTTSPALVARVVEGAAVWIPTPTTAAP
ncbi:MAG TPA: hypothetical protein VFV99_27820 [Kofleriaceae bacterium]|nr:hypothetical protein [Kofleriaceae bacterium]